MNRIGFLAVRIRDSFWFAPAVAMGLAVLLAEFVVLADRSLDLEWAIVIGVGPEGARALLGVIATAMLAAASTMFSITIAVLALTSSAYGPRLVRNFMADRGNQLVLATLVSTSLYALLVVRRVRSDDEPFVPSLAVTLALFLTIVCVALLIYFIHHISTGIQISTLAGAVRVELARRLDQLYPATASTNLLPASDWPAREGDAFAVTVTRDGYIADIGVDALVDAARTARGRIEVTVRPGTFVCAGDRLAWIMPGAAPAMERSEALDRCAASVRAAIAVQDERTPYQDVEYLARQLVDIAVRALSPGVNDPYTAVTAIDALTASFAGTAGHSDPDPVVADTDGVPRVCVARRRWIDVVVEAVDAIRLAVAGQAVVAERLIGMVVRLRERVTDPARREALTAAAERILEGVDAPTLLDSDRRRLAAALTGQDVS